MRTREEILADIPTDNMVDLPERAIERAQLEVLLDIRDLLRVIENRIPRDL
jgi:hypothetical protein